MGLNEVSPRELREVEGGVETKPDGSSCTGPSLYELILKLLRP
jgi:hypothetical protein